MVEARRLTHFTKVQQLDRNLLDALMDRADEFRRIKHSKALDGKIVGLAFYEPSSRTKFSFEVATSRLGGDTKDTENAEMFSSVVKGENYEDTIRVLDKYFDAVVVRTRDEGSVDRMAALSEVPVINAGDGIGQHPTQAMTDIYTIKRIVGRLENLNVAIVGDLLHGRTANSLAYLLGSCARMHIIFISPESLRIKKGIKEYLEKYGCTYEEQSDLDSMLGREGEKKIDIVYMTRLQKERMPREQYAESKGKFVFTRKSLEILLRSNPKAILMHPLPKVDEIDLTVEDEIANRANIVYFEQVRNGLFIRMALLENMLRD